MSLSGVNIGVYFAFLGSRRPKINLRSPRGQPGSNFHIWVQNVMGVLTTKLHSYPINTSQVIPFLRLNTKRSCWRVFTQKVFFRGSYHMSIATIKSLCHRSSFCVNCLFPVERVFSQVLIVSDPTAGFGSNCNKRCILPLPSISLSYSSLWSLEAEKRLPDVRGGLFI